MSRLPFLRIPLLAQLEILKHLEAFDLISLSFCSERTRILVEAANARLDHLDFRFKALDDFIFYVNKFEMFCYQEDELDQTELNGSNVEVVWSDNRGDGGQVVLFESTQSFESLGERPIRHLIETFRKVDDIRVRSVGTAIQAIPVWKYTKTIDELYLNTVPEGRLSIEDMKFIFEELTIRNKMKISSPATEGFQCSRIFQQKEVEISDARWVQFNTILDSQYHKIYLSNIEQPTAAQLNRMLKLWISMDTMKDFKFMSLKWPEGNYLPSTFLTEVLDGIVHVRHAFQFAEFRRIDGKLGDVFLFGIMGICFRCPTRN